MPSSRAPSVRSPFVRWCSGLCLLVCLVGLVCIAPPATAVFPPTCIFACSWRRGPVSVSCCSSLQRPKQVEMFSAQNLLLHLLWLCLGWNHGQRSNKLASCALLEVLREEEPNIYLHSMEHCNSAKATLQTWGCQLPEGVDATVRDNTRMRVQMVIGVVIDLKLSFEQALATLENKGRSQGHLFRAAGTTESIFRGRSLIGLRLGCFIGRVKRAVTLACG